MHWDVEGGSRYVEESAQIWCDWASITEFGTIYLLSIDAIIIEAVILEHMLYLFWEHFVNRLEPVVLSVMASIYIMVPMSVMVLTAIMALMTYMAIVALVVTALILFMALTVFTVFTALVLLVALVWFMALIVFLSLLYVAVGVISVRKGALIRLIFFCFAKFLINEVDFIDGVLQYLETFGKLIVI